MQSLRYKFKTMKKASEARVDQISASNSNQKPGTSKQSDDLPANPNPNPSTEQPNTQVSEHTDEPMEMDFCGPSLPPQFGQSAQSEHRSDPSRSDHSSEHSE